MISKFKLALNDPEKDQQEQNKIKAAENLRRLDRRRQDGDSDSDSEQTGAGRRIMKEDLILNQYESLVAMEVVAPDDIPVGFDGMLMKSILILALVITKVP